MREADPVTGIKLPAGAGGDGVIGVDIRDLGDYKEDYRWIFLIKNNRAKDDYSQLI